MSLKDAFFHGLKTITGLPLETASEIMDMDSPVTKSTSDDPSIPATTPGRFASLAITKSGQRRLSEKTSLRR